MLLRRTRIGLLLDNGGKGWTPRIRRLLQAALGWSDERWNEEAARHASLWARHYGLTASGMPAEEPEG